MRISILLAVVIVIFILILIIYKNKQSEKEKPTPPTFTWENIRTAWPNDHGKVIDKVINKTAGDDAYNWINDNAPNANSPNMELADANVVCNYSCENYSLQTNSSLCNCYSKNSINF